MVHRGEGGTSVAVVAVLALLPLPAACGGTPRAGAEAAQRQHGTPDRYETRVGEDLVLRTGQAARVADTAIEVTLLEARGPREGCHDCPNAADLRVRRGAESTQLRYRMSGGMLPSLLAEARRKEAYGHVFVMIRIVPGEVTLRVERSTGSE